MLADDYAMCFKLPELINSVPEYIIFIVKKTWFFYMTWQGGFFCYLINYPLLSISKEIFNIINSFIFMGSFYLIYRHIIGHKESSPLIYAVSFLTITLLIPSFVQSCLWWTGSLTYLFPLFFTLLFLLFYRLKTEQPSTLFFTIIVSLGVFLLGLLSGNGHGPIALISCGISLGFIIYWKWKKLSIPFWALSGFIGSFIGCALMAFSPGNAARAAIMNQKALENGINSGYLHSAFSFLNSHLITECYCILLLCLILIFLILAFSKTLSINYSIAYIYIITTLLAFFATIFTPASSRTFLFIPVFLIIGFLIILSQFNNFFNVKKLLSTLFAFSFILFLLFSAKTFHYAKHTKTFVEEIEKFARQEVAQGHLQLFLPAGQSFPRYKLFTQNLEQWKYGFSKYIGADTIKEIYIIEEILDVHKAIEYAQKPENQNKILEEK